VVSVIEQDSEAEELIELPEDILVEQVGVVSAARSMEVEQLNEANQSQGWSRPILFYPDGTTSTAIVTLYNPQLGRVVVSLRGITGDVTISEVLLEILLALAILGGSLAILSRIVDTGMIAARESRDLAAARVLCQTKLAEVLLDTQMGISPQGVADAAFEIPFDSQSNSAFQYSIEVLPAPLDGLLSIEISVESMDADLGEARTRYSITRWVIDPLLGLEEAEAEQEALLEEQAALQGGDA
jgi:type II secretory pathway pseudopilin PulG